MGCDVRGWLSSCFFFCGLRSTRSTRLHLAAACLASRHPSVRIPSDCPSCGYLFLPRGRRLQPPNNQQHTHSLCGWLGGIVRSLTHHRTHHQTHASIGQHRHSSIHSQSDRHQRQAGGEEDPEASSSGRRDATHPSATMVCTSINRSIDDGGGAVMVYI